MCGRAFSPSKQTPEPRHWDTTPCSSFFLSFVSLFHQTIRHMKRGMHLFPTPFHIHILRSTMQIENIEYMVEGRSDWMNEVMNKGTTRRTVSQTHRLFIFYDYLWRVGSRASMSYVQSGFSSWRSITSVPHGCTCIVNSKLSFLLCKATKQQMQTQAGVIHFFWEGSCEHVANREWYELRTGFSVFTLSALHKWTFCSFKSKNQKLKTYTQPFAVSGILRK